MMSSDIQTTEIDIFYVLKTGTLADAIGYVVKNLCDGKANFKCLTGTNGLSTPSTPVILLWSHGCSQIQQRDVLIKLNKELCPPAKPQQARIMFILNLTRQDNPFLTYMESCGAVVSQDIHSLLCDVLKAISKQGRFQIQIVERESPIGLQIAAGCGPGDTHGKCWKEQGIPEALSIVVPWLTAYCEEIVPEPKNLT